MIRTTLAAGAIALATAGLAFASGSDKPADPTDPISLRQHVMANLGKATGLGGRMLKGEVEYNAQTARAVFLTMSSVALGFGRMFPEDSMSPDSEAKDTIWSDRRGFRDEVAKFIALTETAAAAPVGDIDAFREQFGAVTASCKSCHEGYRIKKN
jgi:cytochrome c556